MKRVLVTGSAGFLGRHFAQVHLDAGDDVTQVDNESGASCRWSRGGRRLAQDLGDALAALASEEFDRAYHLAAPVGGREKISNDPLFNADSLRLDSAFFRWAVGRVGTVVYPSSSAVYPVSMQGDRAHSLTEGAFSAEGPAWLAPDEMYGFTKLVGERLALAATRYGLNTLCIRPFSGYGEDQGLDYPVPAIATRAVRHEDPIVVWGPGNQKRDFVHVDDIVGATEARLDAGVSGYEVMNIGSGFPVAFDDIARTCANIVGYEPRIVHDAAKPVGVLTRFADTVRMRHYYEPSVGLRDGLERLVGSLS